MSGLVQQPDKIVVRSAHTIYPYSLGFIIESWLHLAISITLAPLLLLRSKESISIGLETASNIKSTKLSLEYRSEKYFSGICLALWALVVLFSIRIYAIYKAFCKIGLNIVFNIPTNWRSIALCTDLCFPPEAIAGIENRSFEVEDGDGLREITVASLVHKLKNDHSKRSFLKKNFRVLVYGLVFLCLFIPSIILRWSLKSSSIVYLPFIYFSKDVYSPQTKPLDRVKAIVESKLSLIWSIFGVWIGLTILPIFVASFYKTTIDVYCNNIVFYEFLNFFTFTPKIERWNIARLVCATLTIILFCIALFRLSQLTDETKISSKNSKSSFLDSIINIITMIRATNVVYLVFCTAIVVWGIVVNIDFSSIQIVMPEIGKSWIPTIEK
jgi:hypothetical protein